jgi:hypothetical protein
MKRTFEEAEEATYNFLATLSHHNLFDFPGARELKLDPEDVRCDAIVIGCVCARDRLNGQINDRWEGRLEAMHMYNIVNLSKLKNFIEQQQQ